MNPPAPSQGAGGNAAWQKEQCSIQLPRRAPRVGDQRRVAKSAPRTSARRLGQQRAERSLSFCGGIRGFRPVLTVLGAANCSIPRQERQKPSSWARGG